MAGPAVSLALLALLAVAQAAPGTPPVFLVPKSFQRHPFCSTTFTSQTTNSRPLWLSYEWWWDTNPTDRAQPLGHAVQQGCVPFNQPMPRKGNFKLDTLQHKHPGVLRDLQLRLFYPDRRFPRGSSPTITQWGYRGLEPLPRCDKRTLSDGPSQPYGPVGCRYSTWRSSVTPFLCKTTGGKVQQTFDLAANDPAATPLTCGWSDDIPYDMAGVKDSGNLVFQALTNTFVYEDAWVQRGPSYVNMDYRVVQVLGSVPFVLQDSPTYKCSAATSANCGWNNDNIYRLENMVYTDDVISRQFTVVNFWPNFLIPVGGVYKIQVKTARLVESDQQGSTKGYKVSRHIITFDDDFRNGKSGKVVLNNTGYLDDDMVTLNLKTLFPAGKEGWHKMTIQAKTVDPVLKGTHTGSLSRMIEIAPACPKDSSVPFFTHVLNDGVAFQNMRLGTFTPPKSDQPYVQLRNSVPTSELNYMRLDFDLSFLNKTRITSATVFLWISSYFPNTLKLATLPLEVYDASRKLAGNCSPTCPGGTNGVTCFKCPPTIGSGVPCIKNFCKGAIQVGQGTLTPKSEDAAPGLGLVALSLDKAFVSKFTGSATPMQLAVIIPRQPVDVQGVKFRQSGGPTSPTLVMQGQGLC